MIEKNCSIISIKNKERKELQREVDDWISQGNVIQQVPSTFQDKVYMSRTRINMGMESYQLSR